MDEKKFELNVVAVLIALIGLGFVTLATFLAFKNYITPEVGTFICVGILGLVVLASEFFIHKKKPLLGSVISSFALAGIMIYSFVAFRFHKYMNPYALIVLCGVSLIIGLLISCFRIEYFYRFVVAVSYIFIIMNIKSPSDLQIIIILAFVLAYAVLSGLFGSNRRTIDIVTDCIFAILLPVVFAILISIKDYYLSCAFVAAAMVGVMFVSRSVLLVEIMTTLFFCGLGALFTPSSLHIIVQPAIVFIFMLWGLALYKNFIKQTYIFELFCIILFNAMLLISLITQNKFISFNIIQITLSVLVIFFVAYRKNMFDIKISVLITFINIAVIIAIAYYIPDYIKAFIYLGLGVALFVTAFAYYIFSRRSIDVNEELPE